jgi:CspA family cold shock protein
VPDHHKIDGIVRWWDGEEGWGVVDGPEVPGGCFVHFSNIVGTGYRVLTEGQRVTMPQPYRVWS